MKVYNPAAQFDFQSVANDRKLHDIGVFILIREPFTTTGMKHITSRVRNRVLIRWWRQQIIAFPPTVLHNAVTTSIAAHARSGALAWESSGDVV